MSDSYLILFYLKISWSFILDYEKSLQITARLVWTWRSLSLFYYLADQLGSYNWLIDQRKIRMDQVNVLSLNPAPSIGRLIYRINKQILWLVKMLLTIEDLRFSIFLPTKPNKNTERVQVRLGFFLVRVCIHGSTLKFGNGGRE